MRTLLLLASLALAASLPSSPRTPQGCDPCLCGMGGGYPPPTGCTYGPWAGQ